VSLLENIDLQVDNSALGTEELVRTLAPSMPERATEKPSKFFVVCELWAYAELNNSLTPVYCYGNPLPFLKCANGTLLPLTLLGLSARMPRENFYHSADMGESN
jgi:hypothetical protein